MKSDLSWVEFILHSFFVIGVLFIIPISIFWYFKMGIKYGFSTKINDSLGDDSILFKLSISIFIFVSMCYYFFIEGDFFKYWNDVVLFFK